jgi:sucrose-6-phosphate hydrolase SacC (GH32 family)
MLQQYPIEEMKQLRILQEKHNFLDISISTDNVSISLPHKVFPAQSEIIATFTLPTHEATFGITVDSLACNITYLPPSSSSTEEKFNYSEVPVYCGQTKDTVRLIPEENSIELRLFSDWTFIEAYFARGRAVITEIPPVSFNAGSTMTATSTAPVNVTIEAYALGSIWVDPDEVRNSARIYPSPKEYVRDARG